MARRPRQTETGGTANSPVDPVFRGPTQGASDLAGTPYSPNIDPRAVTTAGQVLSPPGPAPSPSENQSWGPSPVLTDGMTFWEVGQTGLRQFSGWIREEFLQVLVGRQGAQKYREMRDNSPTIGGLTYAIEATMNKVEWRMKPANDSGEAQEKSDFVDSCRNDMSSSWIETVTDHMSFLTYGFSWNELVYKRRKGRDPGNIPGTNEELPKSEYDDGLIGWRRMPGRSQDTIIKWFFDRNGQTKGVTQQPWVGPLIDMPIEKSLLFRPVHYKNNPEGRALDPETLLPTPKGWRRLDDIQPGDQVFDEAGKPCNVVARADWFDRPSYRVTFSDGCEIIADENHEWLTTTMWERNEGGYVNRSRTPKRRTTKQISQKVLTKHNQAIHAIPWASALQYPRRELPIDPYLLGLWLGDGDANDARIACAAEDAPHIESAIAAAGFVPVTTHNGRQSGTAKYVRANDGAKIALRSLGVLKNKYVPQFYLESSIEQRLALLQGLMDSDGHVTTVGQCSFTNINYSLIQAVVTLVRSLGCGRLDVRQTHKTVAGNQAWNVVFSPPFVPFVLPRKAVRCKERERRTNHYIVDISAVENRRTTCIEVDSKSHLFLAGTSCIPTSNSILRNAYVSYYYSKRLQEQEAILFERLGGVPVIYIPGDVIEAANAGDAQAVASVNMYKKIAINLRTDEQMGLVLPSNTYEGTAGPTSVQQYKFELVAPQMRAASINLDQSIVRYNISMLTSVLADFLTLGHEARGTQSLAVTKVDMFMQATEGYLNAMAGVYNKYAITRLFDLNGFDFDLMPKIEPDLAQRVDLDVLSNFILRISQAGMPLFPDEDLQSYIKDAAGLPDIDDSRALQAAGLTDEQLDLEDEKNQAVVENIKNPPQPAGGSGGPKNPKQQARANMEKMIKRAIAQRQIRHAGPRFGVHTHVHKKQPSVRRLARLLREVQGE